jgi:hypothetical protein
MASRINTMSMEFSVYAFRAAAATNRRRQCTQKLSNCHKSFSENDLWILASAFCSCNPPLSGIGCQNRKI